MRFFGRALMQPHPYTIRQEQGNGERSVPLT